MLNKLAESVAEVCADHPVAEKTLVVPTHVIGNEIVASLATAGQPVFNLRGETVRTLAIGTILDEMARSGERALSRAEEMALVEQACEGVTRYYHRIGGSTGFHDAAARMLREFGEAGLSPDAILIRGNPEKEADLRSMTRRFRDSLETGKLLDRTTLIRRAVDAAKAGDGFILLPGHPDLAADEKELVTMVAGERLIELATDDRHAWKLRADGFVLARAMSEEDELRRMFHRLSAEKGALDQAELVTAAADYLPIVFELCQEHELPATFSEGIPVRYSRPGRAALALLSWLERDFEAETLARSAEAGEIRVGEGNDRLPGSAVAGILRAAKIGWGRDRYALQLDAVSVIRRWTQALLSEVPTFDIEGGCSPSVLAKSLARMVAGAEVIMDELDGAASSAIAGVLEEVSRIERRDRPARATVALLREILDGTSTMSLGPRPGCLHVSPVSSAGYSGRPRTFVVGLDADRFPGRQREDPLLSDAEREAINRGPARPLVLRGDRARENRAEFDVMLSRLRGDVELTYAARDPVEDRRKFPSPVLLDLFRAKPGSEGADFEALDGELRRRQGEEGTVTFLSSADWWIDSVRGRQFPPSLIRERVGELCPLVGSGLIAEAARADDQQFSEYDGHLASARGRFDPRRLDSISPSSIEGFARCPFRWFLENALELKPSEAILKDDDIWLDARDSGSVVHEVLSEFMGLTMAERRKPSLADEGRLQAMGDAKLDLEGTRRPLPRRSTEERTRRRLREICADFLRREQELPGSQRTAGVEVGLGTRTAVDSELGSASPVPLAPSGDVAFRLRGKLDRVDETESGSLVVFDYKTGRRPTNGDRLGLDAGQKIQPLLYALALEARHKRKASRAAYYYLGRRGGGFLENLSDAARLELPVVLSALFDAMGEGSFIHTRDKTRCAGCDFRAICAEDRAAGSAARKLDADVDDALVPFQRLRGWIRNRK